MGDDQIPFLSVIPSYLQDHGIWLEIKIKSVLK